MKNWQLLKCLYTYTGLTYIEIEDPDRWNKHLEKYPEDTDGIGWILGTVIDVDHMPNKVAVKVELEGRKENLEAVLKLINEAN
jgi:hypothetical protein